MPNIPPLITATPEAQSLYYEKGRNAGVVSGLTWTAGSGVNAGSFVATLAVPRITTRSVLLACVDNLAAADIAAGTWLVAAKPFNNSITFLANAAPVTPADFRIAWYFVDQE